MDQAGFSVRRNMPLAIGAVFLVVLWVSGCSPDVDRPLSGRESAERGATVFEYNCGYCHGPGGRGPALADIQSLSSAERRKKIINHPVSGQIPQRLAAHELSDLVEFLESGEGPDPGD